MGNPYEFLNFAMRAEPGACALLKLRHDVEVNINTET
jgi:hypothetical protein